MAWALDIDAITEVARDMGLEEAIRVRAVPLTTKGGDYTWLGAQGHMIRVSTYHRVEGATSSLVHELAHCLQQERSAKVKGTTGAQWVNDYTLTHNVTGYENHPMEIEAREVAEAYSGPDLVIQGLTKPKDVVIWP